MHLASLLGPQEGESSKILPNARFFKSRAGQYEQKFISRIYNVQKGLKSHYILTL